MDKTLKDITIADLTESIGDAYRQGYAKGREDQRVEHEEATKRRKAYYDAKNGRNPSKFLELLRESGMLGEYDRRINEILNNARAKWEAQQAASPEEEPIAPIEPLALDMEVAEHE